MEKHFHVLFKSEMIYENERLRGVQCHHEKLMKPRADGWRWSRAALVSLSNGKRRSIGDAGRAGPALRPRAAPAAGRRTRAEHVGAACARLSLGGWKSGVRPQQTNTGEQNAAQKRGT